MIFLGNVPYVIGKYTYWEHEEKPELWRIENSENSEWKKLDLIKNDGWKPIE